MGLILVKEPRIKKPTDPIPVDANNPLAPDELFAYPLPDMRGWYDAVSNTILTTGGTETGITPGVDETGSILNYDGTVQAYINTPKAIQHATTQPWSFSWYGNTVATNGGNDGVFAGVPGTTTNYLWMKGSGQLSINPDGTQYIYGLTVVPWHIAAWNTVVFTAPGFDFYRGGIFIGSETAANCPSDLIISCIGASFSAASFAFDGMIGTVAIHSFPLTAIGVADFCENPWQVVQPDETEIPIVVVGGAVLEADFNASGNVSAALTTGISLASSASVSGTVSADLTTDITLATARNATATVSPSLTTAIAMAVSLSVSANVAADLTTGTLLNASLDASAAIASDLTTGIALATALSGTGTLVSALTVGNLINANLSASGAVSGDLTTQIAMASSLSASGSVFSDLTTGIAMAASMNITATIAADLVTKVAPDLPGLEYTIDDGQLHYTIDNSQLHYTIPKE